MRSLWTMGLLIAVGGPSFAAFSASALVINVAVHWEGRELQAPNVDALDRMRRSLPDIPLTHFVNPVYFLDEAKAGDNLESMKKIFAEHDEVGLYLAPMEALVKEAGLILKLSPSFWGYMGEGDLCVSDCGLDVPLTVYTREETLRLLASAQQTMHQAGFSGLKSFMVRGWMEAPYLAQFASAFGYRFDLSPVDPVLVSAKLREFPISFWVEQRWGSSVQADGVTAQQAPAGHPLVRKIFQRGGILEMNERQEILERFDRFVKEGRADEVFTLALSTESAFQSWPKLRMILESLQEKAKKQNIALRYATASGAKNSRPVAANMRISTRFSQQAEAAE